MNILSLLPALIVLSGTFFLIKLRFFFILKPKQTAKALKSSLSGSGAFGALMLSLAGTLGVGNIVGVAFGISVGGAGSVFWLLVSALFSTVLKYCEATLASDMKDGFRGGIMYVIKKSFRAPFSSLAYVYAFLCILLALTMGSALQARSAVESTASEKHELVYALIFTLAVAFAILGGSRKIEKITLWVIPIATAVYIFLCIFVIFQNYDRLGGVLRCIFKEAFSFKAGAGGILGFLLSVSVREGFCRGLLSNEAGAGTSSMAHSRNPESSAVSVGLVGMCEVFFDTVLLCMLTALTVLCALPSLSGYSSGIEIISAALSSLGPLSQPLLSASVIAFAYSTVICWYYYGELSLDFITKRGKWIFTVFFLISVFFGALTPSSLLIVISDYILFLLTAISLIALIKNSDRLVHLSESFGIITKRGYATKRSHRKKLKLQALPQHPSLKEDRK